MIHSSKIHLDEVDETYAEHLRAAFAIAMRLATASAACTLHALIPGLCTHSASRRVAAVNATLATRSKALKSHSRDAIVLPGASALLQIETESS